MNTVLYITVLAIIAQTGALPRHLKVGLGRIVGGYPAAVGSVPHQISLEYYGEHMCGGTILDKTKILTAAHCVDFLTAKEIRIRLGTNTINPPDQWSQIVNVKEIWQHEEYNSRYLWNDIAMLNLEKPMELDRKYNHTFNIEIAGPSYTPQGDATISGWGTLQEGSLSLSTNLMSVTVPFVDAKSCNASYEGDVTVNMICAGFTEGAKDSCQGDSGGPLVDAHNVLCGIVSWGHGCARPSYPGVYTRVSAYTDWITSKSYAEVRWRN